MPPIARCPRPRVLLVHADPRARLRGGRLLARTGARVDASADAARAVRLIHRHRYDLVLSDALLPDASGLAVWEELRRTADGAESRFALLVEGAASPDVTGFAREQGLDLLALPIDEARLEELVEAL
jgi:CheY-like chemotaxis protein